MYNPLCFQKVVWVEGGGATAFSTTFLAEKVNRPGIWPSLMVTWAKLNFVTALLSPCPTSLTYFLNCVE